MATNKNNTNKNTLLKVVILGDGGVGKSCLMNRFVNNRFDDHSFHTIGVEFLNKEIQINNAKYTLQIWDTAGQERFKSLRTPFYRGADICLLTFSIDEKSSFQNLTMWKKEFVQYADINAGTPFPFVVVANKVDIEDSKREVSETEVFTWCKDNGNLPYIETSAKTASNVETAFKLAVEIWLKQEELMDKQSSYPDDTIKLNSQFARKSMCCTTAS